MNKNLIVEIFVPLPGYNCQEGEFATGYPVARNLILTARHPLYPNKSQYDKACKIEVRWRHSDVQEKDWLPIKDVAWESDKWDLALLECEMPPGISDWGFLSEQKPDHTMQWVSVGFPRVGGKKGGIRKPFNMKGEVHSTLDTEEQFPIATNDGPDTEDEWKGASGSPVFVNWRILGVIVSVPEKLKAKRLWAVPIWRVLREDKSFRAKLGYDEREARCKSVQRKLTAALTPAPLAADALADQIPGCSEGLVGESARKKAEIISECLLRLEVDQVLRACKQAHGQVRGSEPDAKAIAAAVQIILPAIYDHGIVEAVRNARDEIVNAALIALPTHYSTVAEIIMAGADRRETLFCPRKREGDFPKGRLCLPEPPEGGFDSDGQRALDALNRHLTGKFSLAPVEFQYAVDDFMIRRFYQPVSERTREQKIEGAASEIRYQSEQEGRTHYLIVELPENTDDRRILENVLHQIRGRYPALICLTLNHDWAIERAEFDCFRPLLSMLSKIPENRHEVHDY